MTALSVKYIRELLMSLIPRASKGTDGQYSEPLVNGIVVGGTDKHATNARTLIEGIGMVNTHDVAVKRELQSANKFLTIIGKYRCITLLYIEVLLQTLRKHIKSLTSPLSTWTKGKVKHSRACAQGV